VLLAWQAADGALRFSVVSGAPPLVEVADPVRLLLRIPGGIGASASAEHRCGGLVISFAQARRARLNGLLRVAAGVAELRPAETFTLCRKYIAPSAAVDGTRHVGPRVREPVALTDPWVADLVSRADGAFLATLGPDGGPDVAYRGGPPGFLQLDAAGRRISWPEYVGDGVFKSAGNLRTTGVFTLLVPDLASGDAVELVGRGDYVNVRAERKPRTDALVRHREPFPVQGTIAATLSAAARLRGLLRARQPVARAARITSQSAVEEQAPQ
jgi:hypothetical protein